MAKTETKLAKTTVRFAIDIEIKHREDLPAEVLHAFVGGLKADLKNSVHVLGGDRLTGAYEMRSVKAELLGFLDKKETSDG